MVNSPKTPLDFLLRMRLRTLAVMCGTIGVVCLGLAAESFDAAQPSIEFGALVVAGVVLVALARAIWSEKMWSVEVALGLALVAGFWRTIHLALLGQLFPSPILVGVGLPLLIAVYAARILVLARRGSSDVEGRGEKV